MNVDVIFRIRLRLLNDVTAENQQTESCLTMKAGFIIREPAQQELEQLASYINEKLWETKSLQTELARNGIDCQYKYSAKERVDIGKDFTKVLWLPYLLCQLGNTRTLK